MKKNYLFPQVFKRVGLWFFIPFAVMGIGCLFGNGWWRHSSSEGLFSSGLYGYFPTIAIAGIAASLLLICFSREKDEDEYVNDLRCRTLVWSVISGYLVHHSRGFVHLRYGVPHFHVRKHVHGTGALRRGI